MSCDLGEAVAVATPAGVRIGVVDEHWEPTELPYDGPRVAALRRRLAADEPRRVWHVGAWRNDEPVGHATLSVTTGRVGVAGVYDRGWRSTSGGAASVVPSSQPCSSWREAPAALTRR
jgi:hypothetical protein